MKKGYSIVIESYAGDGCTYELSNSFFDSKELASKALVNIVKGLNDCRDFNGMILDDEGNISECPFECEVPWYDDYRGDTCYPNPHFDDDGLLISYSISYALQEEEIYVHLVEQSINDVDNVERFEL